MLQRIQERLVNQLSLIIALVLLQSLLLERSSLSYRIIHLRVGVADFLLADKRFKPFRN